MDMRFGDVWKGIGESDGLRDVVRRSGEKGFVLSPMTAEAWTYCR